MTLPSSLSTTFNFLAALYERNQDVYNSVYLPIIGHAFALYAKSGRTMGSLEDIQELLQAEFGLAVPILLIEKLTKSFAKSLSRKELSDSSFVLNKDNSFSFLPGAFYKRILAYDEYRDNAVALQKGFDAFNQAKGVSTSISFSDFLNEYKNRLSSFFGSISHDLHSNEDLSYILHLDYLQYIEKHNPTLYHIAEKIYLGSIIAGYLESGQTDFKKNGLSTFYYFDTRLILALIDLQEDYETRPVRDLVRLIQSQNGQVQAMDATIDEVRLNIQKTLDRFSPDKPNSTINDACIRQKLGKIDLRSILNNLEELLLQDYHIKVVPMPKETLTKASCSSRLEKLQSTRFNKKNALHDIAVSDVVAARRTGNKFDFKKATYWFVTSNDALCRFNRAEHEDKSVPEIVSIDDLTSILFFQCPQRDIARLSSAGLRQVIAQSLSYELPSRDLLSEFDNQVKKNLDITYEQYEDICMEVARFSAKRVDELILQSVESKELFEATIHTILQDAKKKEGELKQKQLEAEQLLNRRMDEITNELKTVKVENRKLKIATVSLVSFILAGLIIYFFRGNLSFLLKVVLVCIISLGGLWSFITFVVALLRFSHND